MRLLFFSVIVLIVAVSLALLTQDETGYVLVHYGSWSVETSFTFASLLLLLAFLLTYVVLRLIIGAMAAPARLAAWRSSRRDLRARRATNRGLVALAQGDWAKAERDLSRHAARSETPLLNYLGAAHAAQKSGDEARRDNYLSTAYKHSPTDELAIGATQAELQLKSGQLEQALATLMHLYGEQPKNARVLQLLQRVYEQMASWDELLDLLPQLRKYQVLTAADIELLERRIWEALLCKARAQAQLEKLQQLWGRIPRQMRQQTMLLTTYARGLLALQADEEAERLLREAIRRQWDADLVYLYGLAKGRLPARQLDSAEEWLKHHERHPLLLLTLGRLAMRAELWGKARSYLEASVGVEPRAEACQLLGELLERLGEEKSARKYYHQGLSLVTGDSQSLGVVPLKRLPLMPHNKESTE
ncbi:MAG: heme biosynthesis HemY N-terminal domain-containing protein [Thiohalomonadaceae bacterium]